MLQVIEQNPRRMVLRDRSPLAGIVALIFLALSAAAVGLLSVQGLQDFSARIQRFDGGVWALGMVIFLALGVGLALLGVMAVAHFWIGTLCVFDKDSAEWTVKQVALFRPQTRRHSLYAVRQIDVEENDLVQAFGVFLVLKNGERIPLGAYPRQDEATMRQVVGQLRGFLRG